MTAPHPSDLHHFPYRADLAKAICLVTIALVFVGGVVTSNNAGLAVPDWPTSFGYQMWAMPFSMWKGGILYEHSHRVLASVLGLLVMAMTIWVMAKESRRRIRLIALACLAIVILQGIIGGVGVLLSLPVFTSVAHGVLAQVFFCLTIVLAYGLSREQARRLQQAPGPVSRGLLRGVIAVALLIAAQLVLAAYMRHELKFQGGIAIPDFPTTAGRWLPWVDARSVDWVNTWREAAVREHGAPFNADAPLNLTQLAVHLAHRAMAAVIVAALLGLTVAVRRHYSHGSRVRATVYAMDGLVLAQVILGAFVVWSSRGPLITSLHVATGAGLLGLSVLLALRILPPTWAAAVPAKPEAE